MLDIDNVIEQTNLIINDHINIKYLNVLSEPEKTYLSTGLSCYIFLRSIEKENSVKMDYSASVCPLMKTLEFEIKDKLYFRYINYLKEKVSISEYINRNQASLYTKDKEIISVIKKAIFCCDNNQLRYIDCTNIDEYKSFSIGTFKYACSTKPKYAPGVKYNSSVIDNTFIDFCKKMYFSNIKDNEIEKWIVKLIKKIETLRLARNDCTHPGKIININEAEKSIKTLINDKLIVTISFPSDFMILS